MLHSTCSEKTAAVKILFFLKKIILFSIIFNYWAKLSVPSTNFFHQACQTAFSMSRLSFPRKLGFLLKNSPGNVFRSLLERRWDLPRFFSTETSELRLRCPKHLPEEKISEKKVSQSFLFDFECDFLRLLMKNVQQGSQSCILVVQREIWRKNNFCSKPFHKSFVTLSKAIFGLSTKFFSSVLSTLHFLCPE